MLDILEPEVWECAIAGQFFRFVELTDEELRQFVRRYQELGTKAALRLVNENLTDFADAFRLVEAEEHAFHQWLLNSSRTENEEVSLDWVAQNVTPSIRRRLHQGISKLNNLDERTGNLQRLLILTGRITPGDAPLTQSAGATASVPQKSDDSSPADRSSPGPTSASEETG